MIVFLAPPIVGQGMTSITVNPRVQPTCDRVVIKMGTLLMVRIVTIRDSLTVRLPHKQLYVKRFRSLCFSV